MPRRVALTIASLAAVATICTVPATVVVPPGQAATDDPPQPVYVDEHFGDPSVVKVGSGYVAVGTGTLVPRVFSSDGRTWEPLPPALERLPTWAREGHVWASDIARVKGRWVLYFSAPVKGLTVTGRCIGVAVSATARGSFVPDDTAPLVCPPKGKTPAAGNQVPDRNQLPRHGVIDPSLFVTDAGRPLLLYKTDGRPSTIRVLPLRRNGRAPKAGATSREILRSTGVIENPVLVQRSRGLYLFTSEGDYTRCTYATTWRTGRRLADLATAVPSVLIDRKSTRLCGPAGADVLETKGRTDVFLHAWACADGAKPCRRDFNTTQIVEKRAIRSMYAVRLRFRGGVPVLGSWRRPHQP